MFVIMGAASFLLLIGRFIATEEAIDAAIADAGMERDEAPAEAP
jgi:hypothetical protein